ncbi:MAG: DUF2382 domain-containing protein [Paracoccus denitrificans]|uniref:DUF2382 domain-containing protein n=1 Tax=Paracoccus denitrificans TaxID=266 RepID=A0A533IEG4_PARDE|nr:MAG: DUF2382 domain-containing protein [Paracoccus denitrificans]
MPEGADKKVNIDHGKTARIAEADLDNPTIEIAEEVATIRKRVVDHGGVRLETITDTHEELLSTDLLRSEITVQRVPRDEVVAEAPRVREEGNVTIIPILEERAVIRTELVLVEEVHLIRTETTDTVEVPVSLRRQRAVETRLKPDGSIDKETRTDASFSKEQDDEL